MANMLAKGEKNCPWGCCPAYGHNGDKAVVRREARRKEKRVWRKMWNAQYYRRWSD